MFLGLFFFSRFVDEIDSLVDKYASLKHLWYWRDGLFECFSRAIKDGPNQPLHAATFLRLCAQFPDNITPFNVEEVVDELLKCTDPFQRDEIGTQVVEKGEKLVDEITSRISALLNEVAKQYIAFDNQLAEVNAAYPLLLKRKEYRPPKDFVPPSIPGIESEYRRRNQLDRLRLYERNAWQLCTALNEFQSITIFDHHFSPREVLPEPPICHFSPPSVPARQACGFPLEVHKKRERH